VIAVELVGVDAAVVDVAVGGDGEKQHGGDGVEAGGCPMPDALATPALVD
jgi:hypothetical protein